MKSVLDKFIFSVILMMTAVHFCSGQILFEEHVELSISSYNIDGEEKGAALPKLKDKSSLIPYHKRFDYVLMNAPHLHTMEALELRKQLFALYPDTSHMKKEIMQCYFKDEHLQLTFNMLAEPIINARNESKTTYSIDELMHVASRFFHCKDIHSDTTIATYICIGNNGVRDLSQTEKYTLLAAYCYEAIFKEIDKNRSSLYKKFEVQRDLAISEAKQATDNLEQILLLARANLYDRMKLSEEWKNYLLRYYSKNKGNLPFIIQA